MLIWNESAYIQSNKLAGEMFNRQIWNGRIKLNIIKEPQYRGTSYNAQMQQCIVKILCMH